ncbi:MAG: hypothetical protein QGF59_20740 [Pirellulaceae bacterium]|nr:hypothetical protein [Pirellulaceae bacterium]
MSHDLPHATDGKPASAGYFTAFGFAKNFSSPKLVHQSDQLRVVVKAEHIQEFHSL